VAFIIVNTTNPDVEKSLRKWRAGKRRETTMKEYIIRQLGPGTFLMRANEAVLALLLDLRKRHNGNVYVFVADALEVDAEFPNEVVEVVEKCRMRGGNLLEKDLKKLAEIRISCSVSWSQS
jgi:hypothetical protein